ncbi:MAG: lipoyl(octanoyl) transferase LipB [Bacteroidia bacterium]
MQKLPLIILKKAIYKPTWDLQEQILAHNLAIKKENKGKEKPKPTISTLMLCEHNPVYTLGKSGKLVNLLLTKEQLKAKKIDYWHINRGGDITYHGPGQITGYPIFDLEIFRPSASWFIETMEDAIIDCLLEFGIKAQRIDGLTGVWIKGASEAEDRKICAIGVKMSRWVSIHGFALNVDTNLNYYNHIVPCGIDDKGVTSISKELGKKVSIDDVIPVLYKCFEQRFKIQFNNITLDGLNQLLGG